MNTTPRRHLPRFFPLICVTVLLCLSSICYGTGTTALAEASPSIPEPSTDYYFNDQAGLLSDATKASILTKNAELSQYSIQLVVLTTDALPVSGYTQRVEYLRQVMQSWHAGGEDGRGLLLAISVSDQDYLAVAGEGLRSYFTTELIKSLLDTQLEPDFASGAYDAGIAKFISEAASQAQAFASSPEGIPASARPEGKKEGLPVLLWVALGAGAVAVICIAVFILAGRPSRRRRGSRRGVHRHAPLVTPSRTNVLRRENHTPMVIKSSHRGDGPSRIRKL